MAFIKTVSEEEAQEDTAMMYQKYVESKGYVPNFAKAFSHRPEVMAAWAGLHKSIRHNLDPRRYELVTLAAARALKSSYCMLAHGSVLLNSYYNSSQLIQIAKDYGHADLSQAEVAMMAYAEKIVKDATSVSQQDIDTLKGHGFSDADIFDIAATATARCFFSKLLDAVGTEADAHYADLDDDLREVLTVGRAISK